MMNLHFWAKLSVLQLYNSKINVTNLNKKAYLPYTLIYLIIKFLFLLAVKREPCI